MARAGILLMGWFAISADAASRFPPPDFESGYQLPVTQHPAVRALWMQYVDVAVLAVTLGLATYLVLRRRSRQAVVGLSMFSVAYFGFYREGCICAIGSPQNIVMALFNPQYSVPLAVTAFFVLPLVTALFFGRTFCAAVCPHGALQDLILVKPLQVPAWLEKGLGLIPYVYLGAGLLFAATGSTFIICRYDPIVPIFRLTGGVTMLAFGAALVVIGMFVGRPYCRFLCPYGALLRMASAVSRYRVTVTPDVCTQCRLCEQACPFGVILEPATTPTRSGLAAGRRRFLTLLLALPLLIGLGGWVGSLISQPASRLHPTVALAETLVQKRKGQLPGEIPAVTALALERGERTSRELLPQARDVQRKFRFGGWWFGGWIGLVIGVRLLGGSIWHRRADYEPDRAGCYACARCFKSCPQELVRLGLSPATEPGALPALAAASAPALSHRST